MSRNTKQEFLKKISKPYYQPSLFERAMIKELMKDE